MLSSNTYEQNVLSDTLALFRNSDGYMLTPSQGVLLIDSWLQVLEGDPNIDEIKGQLDELRTAIQAEQPDTLYIGSLLNSLAEKSENIASDDNSEGTWTGGLVSLARILRNVSEKINE
ncbi:hypothetical protein IC229_20085 [Spirosoma sp. BT702]|uniref:Uncharacterized protein n=1 Tax=Spirosoma profusum TaxID=2771354 RepID=A0A927AU83_9BACT|nr:hypothetical protein [Spirosoma profusum]MBD2702957.1 hypothetical protein [Spirosoma profusum]